MDLVWSELIGIEMHWRFGLVEIWELVEIGCKLSVGVFMICV